MIRRTLGAPLGGTTCGGQYGFDLLASRLMTPPNFDGGGGRYFPSMVVVALGEPGVPVVCCAGAGAPMASSKEVATSPHEASRCVSSRCLSIMGHSRLKLGRQSPSSRILFGIGAGRYCP